jgi:hypothetical protein
MPLSFAPVPKGPLAHTTAVAPSGTCAGLLTKQTLAAPKNCLTMDRLRSEKPSA